MSYTIYHNLVIKADKHGIFKAISEPEYLINWWPLKCSGIPKLGESYNFNFTDHFYGRGMRDFILASEFSDKRADTDPEF